nr:hypothetical protein [Tanacetum cinerariifolium]
MCLRMSQFGQITHTHMIVPLFDTMLVQQGEGSGIPTEAHHTPSLEAQPPSHTTHSSSTLPPITTTSNFTVTPSDTTPIRQYTRRARIAYTKGYFPVAAEGSMQQTINELTALCTRLQRQYSELAVKFEAQGIEITRLKARLKLLEDRQGVPAEGSGDDAPIKGRNLDEEEAAAERASDDIEEMTTMLTSIDTAIVLASRAVEIDAQVARELEEQLERDDQRRSAQIARDAKITRIHAEEEL